MLKFAALSKFSPANIAIAAAAVAGVAAVAYVASRKASGDGRTAAQMLGEDVGFAVAKAAGGLVVGAGVGAVKGAGAVVGIPDTNAEKCAAAKAAGNTIEASFYCDAADWLQWITQSDNAPISQPYVMAPDQNPLRPTLRRGAKGTAVQELQGKLNIPPDGFFGPGTENAVKKFQLSVRLISDGIVGPATWEALDNGYAPMTQSGVLTDSKYRDMVR